MIFGYTAVYSRFYHKAGIVGFIGYVFIITAYIFQAAKGNLGNFCLSRYR